MLAETVVERPKNIPFNATVFFLTDWMAASGMAVFPFTRIGVTSTSSHWMGT